MAIILTCSNVLWQCSARPIFRLQGDVRARRIGPHMTRGWQRIHRGAAVRGRPRLSPLCSTHHRLAEKYCVEMVRDEAIQRLMPNSLVDEQRHEY